MTPAEDARIQAILDDIRARLEQYDAREPERIRLKIKSHVAAERLHRAAIAVREAQPNADRAGWRLFAPIR